MNNAKELKDTRLLEALEFIDDSYVADVFACIKAPNVTAAPASGKGKILRSLKYLAAVAACALLLSTIIPMVQYISGNLHINIPGLFESTSELTEEIQTESDDATTEEVIEYPDFDIPFPEDEIRNAYIAMYPNQNEGYNNLVIENRGAVNGAFAVYIYYKDAFYPDVIGTAGANGYTFYFPTDVTTEIYYEGEFYSISEAFSNSIINAKDIEKLYNYHKTLYPYLY